MLRKQGFVALAVAGLLGVGVTSSLVVAQDSNGEQQNRDNRDRGGDRGGDRGNRGGFRGFDPSQMWQQFKEQLGASDDEWKVLQPRIEKVFTMSRDARFGGMGFGGFSSRDRGGDRGGSSSRTESAVGRARADLQSALDDKSISNEEIAKRLEAYRAAKEQAKQDLAAAQKELKELLSQRQEALLVSRGLLD